jgi:hypothetical protein
MTRFRSSAVASLMFAAWGFLFALPQAAHAIGRIHVSDPSVCIDEMETDPGDDDGDTILVAADGACMIQQLDIISI